MTAIKNSSQSPRINPVAFGPVLPELPQRLPYACGDFLIDRQLQPGRELVEPLFIMRPTHTRLHGTSFDRVILQTPLID
jgi:hypothetical protein